VCTDCARIVNRWQDGRSFVEQGTLKVWDPPAALKETKDEAVLIFSSEISCKL
jgi:hypothetical protein